MSRKALYEKATGKVVNIIRLEDGADWQPPEGCAVVDAETAGGIGDIWDGAKFIQAPVAKADPDIAAFKHGTASRRLDILARRAGLK